MTKPTSHNYLVIGPPGSGKSTQAQLLAEKLKLPHLSSGKVFRQVAQRDTPLGNEIKKAMTEGNTLVDDDTAVELFTRFFKKQGPKEGFVLDGFPRNVPQAKKFQHNFDLVFYLDLPDKVGKDRLLKRGQIENRVDDTEETINKRFTAYHKTTEPLLDFYKDKGTLVRIDGDVAIEKIHQNILQKLSDRMNREEV